MLVWLVNPFDNLPQEGTRAQRYWLMARAFVRAGHEVVYWTGDFSHATKAPRKLTGDWNEKGIRLELIPTRPYRRNVSWARIFSHRALAAEFEHRATRGKSDLPRPQIVIASLPPLGLCDAARRVAAKCGALFIADVQDAWPETFERVVPRFVLSALGLYRTARCIYRTSDGVSAVASRYLDLAKEYGCMAPTRLAGHAIEISSPNALSEKARTANGEAPLRLVYAGNMGKSYDLETLLQVVAHRPDVTLDLAGNGPDRARLERLVAADNIRFHGYLGEEALQDLLRSCVVGLIPMFPESCVGVPGKLADYAAAELRVIESLGGETAAIVDRYRVGAHYRAGDAASLEQAIERIKSSVDVSADFRGFKSLFDATAVMDAYVKWVEGLSSARARGDGR